MVGVVPSLFVVGALDVVGDFVDVVEVGLDVLGPAVGNMLIEVTLIDMLKLIDVLMLIDIFTLGLLLGVSIVTKI